MNHLEINQIQEIGLDECEAVGGGFIMVALYFIWESARHSSGGNSDMSSWGAA